MSPMRIYVRELIGSVPLTTAGSPRLSSPNLNTSLSRDSPRELNSARDLQSKVCPVNAHFSSLLFIPRPLFLLLRLLERPSSALRPKSSPKHLML